MFDAQYHSISKIEEVEFDDAVELPNEPILLYYKNYDAMIELYQMIHKIKSLITLCSHYSLHNKAEQLIMPR